MKVALTGATGLVGHQIAVGLLARGHSVVALGRRPVALEGVAHRPYDLDGPASDLSGVDALVHAAFSHVPGKYRGGEGDDPDAFLRRNLGGTQRLFAASETLDRVVFLSSRAVYGAYPAGTELHEDLPSRPDTLYGQVKHDAETALWALSGPTTVSLRATGVYGPTPTGLPHKWADLFAQFRSGQLLDPRIGTEVHGGDLTAAVHLLLTAPRDLCSGAINVSDFMLDRRDLLETYAKLTGERGIMPDASDPASVSTMCTGKLRALGWQPTGATAFTAQLAEMLATGGEIPRRGPAMSGS